MRDAGVPHSLPSGLPSPQLEKDHVKDEFGTSTTESNEPRSTSPPTYWRASNADSRAHDEDQASELSCATLRLRQDEREGSRKVAGVLKEHELERPPPRGLGSPRKPTGSRVAGSRSWMGLPMRYPEALPEAKAPASPPCSETAAEALKEEMSDATDAAATASSKLVSEEIDGGTSQKSPRTGVLEVWTQRTSSRARQGPACAAVFRAGLPLGHE